jgi:hypothetical protein
MHKNEQKTTTIVILLNDFINHFLISLSLSIEVMSLYVRECNDESKLGIDTIVSASTDKTARIWKWCLFAEDIPSITCY